MHTIEVDFDVFKALTLRRPNEHVTENDVLRELLDLPARLAIKEVNGNEPERNKGAWITKGVTFPERTEFRAHYKGRTYLARVIDGALVINNESFDSPSAAAMKITGNHVNGWNFWEYRLPNQGSWQSIKGLRRA